MIDSHTKKFIKKQAFVILYIVAIFVVATSVGKVTKITTYNVKGVNSLKSSHLVEQYKTTTTEVPKIDTPTRKTYKYRLTSFYPNDELKTGDCTGSGLCSWDLKTDSHGWYTYNGKLVLAAATTYLIKQFGYTEGKTYFKYYDEVNITIDGVTYPGIILDTCGACYHDERLDLFVKNGSSVIDRGYMGRNMITVEITKKK